MPTDKARTEDLFAGGGRRRAVRSRRPVHRFRAIVGGNEILHTLMELFYAQTFLRECAKAFYFNPA